MTGMAEEVDGLLRARSRPPGVPARCVVRVAEVVRLTREQPPRETTHLKRHDMATRAF